MTFCFFSAQYLPTVGGVERYTHNLATALVKKGHNAIVVTSSINGLPANETTKDGIKIYRLPVLRLMGGRFPVLLPNKTFFMQQKKLMQEDIQLCVIQTRFYTNSIFGAFFAAKKNVSSIVIEHGTAHLMRGGLVGVLGNMYEHFAFWLIRKKTKNIYGVSKACCDWLAHFNVETDKVLYNAVSPVELQQAVTEQAIRTVNNYIPLETKTVVCFSGRFVPEKGVLPLLNAFSRVCKLYPDTILLMAGDGVLFDTAKQLGCENVVFFGEVDYSTSLAIFKRSDIFCLPTFSEGFATTVLEAVSLDTMVITTRTGGSPELIKTPSHGILLESMEQQDIFNALQSAIENPAYRKTACENAKKVLLENFTWDRLSGTIIQIAKAE